MTRSTPRIRSTRAPCLSSLLLSLVLLVAALLAWPLPAAAQTAKRWKVAGDLPQPQCRPVQSPSGASGLDGYVSACRTAYRGEAWSCVEGWDSEHQVVEYVCTGPDGNCCSKEGVEAVDLPVLDDVGPPTPKQTPAGDTCKGNPIYPLRGEKREWVDTPLRIGRLPLRLTYSTGPLLPVEPVPPGQMPMVPMYVPVAPGWSRAWSSSAHRNLVVQHESRRIVISRGDGQAVSFARSEWPPYVYTASGGSSDQLIFDGTYRYTSQDDNIIERYSDIFGLLIEMIWPDGQRVSFNHGGGRLLQATDHHGRTLRFEYDDHGLISKLIANDAPGISLSHEGTAPYLSSLTWPDGMQRRFLYEMPSHPWALTGVVDENSARHSTFGYDAEGRAVSTEYAGGVNRYSVGYASAPWILSHDVDQLEQAPYFVKRTHTWKAPTGIVVTDPLGSTQEIGIATIGGRTLLSTTSQAAGSGCAASTRAQSYDAGGNLVRRDDFNGTRTCYANDAGRNLETARVEGLNPSADCSAVLGAGSLPAGSRKISTAWHPDWKFPIRLAEPGRITTSVYNGQPDPFNGGALASCAPASAQLPGGKPIVVLCKEVQQATTDKDGGLGFGAALKSGVADKKTSWTYNQHGQVLTEDGPRNDVADVTSYAYYTDTTADHMQGDLKQVTNAAGQVTRYTKYNKDGQVLESVDPNGIITGYTYDLRQRLLGSSTGGRTTHYEYDGVGQLKKLTLPDTSWIGYDYDDAHRQVAVRDHKGNRIDYVLDNTGQRTAEHARDPGGNLKRQLARSIDALGRVQQTTGRE